MLAFLTAIALPLSTALQNATLPLIVCSVILSKELRSKLPQIIKEPLVIISLAFYALFLLGSIWSTGSAHDISKMLLKMIGLVELPFIIAFFSSEAKRKSALWGFGVGIALTIFSLIFQSGPIIRCFMLKLGAYSMEYLGCICIIVIFWHYLHAGCCIYS